MAIEPSICNPTLAAFGAGARADGAYVPEDQPPAIARGVANWLKALER